MSSFSSLSEKLGLSSGPFAALVLLASSSCSSGEAAPPVGAGGAVQSDIAPVTAGGAANTAADAAAPDAPLAIEDAGASDITTDAGAPPAPAEIPALFSQAGLYAADGVTLAPGVRPFQPRFELWSDGADKRRWIYLPDGAQIDTTTSMEYWSYPAGTRIYKEFSVDGVRVETRLLHRQENGAWWMMAYQWRADQTDADAVPNGVVDASGTAHDIPSTEDCRTCHLRMPDKVIGFSAIELAHEVEPEDPSAWSLARLQAEGKLTSAPPELPLFPDDELGREVLGYMHANCGFCHQPRSSVSSRVALSLWLRSDAVTSVAQTPTYASTVGLEVDLSIEGPQGFPVLIDPGSPDTSALYLRVVSRGEEYSMPPLATQQVDTTASELLRQWIASLVPRDAGAAAPQP